MFFPITHHILEQIFKFEVGIQLYNLPHSTHTENFNMLKLQ